MKPSIQHQSRNLFDLKVIPLGKGHFQHQGFSPFDAEPFQASTFADSREESHLRCRDDPRQPTRQNRQQLFQGCCPPLTEGCNGVLIYIIVGCGTNRLNSLLCLLAEHYKGSINVRASVIHARQNMAMHINQHSMASVLSPAKNQQNRSVFLVHLHIENQIHFSSKIRTRNIQGRNSAIQNPVFFLSQLYPLLLSSFQVSVDSLLLFFDDPVTFI